MGSSGGVRRALGGRKLGGMEGDQQKLDEAEAREFSDWLRKQGDLTYRGLTEFPSDEHGIFGFALSIIRKRKRGGFSLVSTHTVCVLASH